MIRVHRISLPWWGLLAAIPLIIVAGILSFVLVAGLAVAALMFGLLARLSGSRRRETTASYEIVDTPEQAKPQKPSVLIEGQYEKQDEQDGKEPRELH